MKVVYNGPHDTLPYTPSADTASGEVVVLGQIVGFTNRPIAAGELGALVVAGRATFQKAHGAISAGDPVYWDADGNPYNGTAGTGAATTTASGNKFAGYAENDAAEHDETVDLVMRPDNGADVDQTALAVADGSAVTFGTHGIARSGNNLVVTLPTSDPGVANALYVTGGAVKVSTGS